MIGTPYLPEPDRTVGIFSDPHLAASGGMATNRQAIVVANLMKRTVPEVAAYLVTGDLTVNGIPAEDAVFNAFIASLGIPEDKLHILVGNHDFQENSRTISEAETALGAAQTPWAVDLGFVSLVGFFPGEDYYTDDSGSLFTDANLNALDTLLGQQTNPVWLFNHFPLYGTVGVAANPLVSYRSIDDGFYAATQTNQTNSDGVLDMLAGHADVVRAWFCGHTHSHPSTDGFATTVTVGSSQIATVNASALVSVDRASAVSRYTLGPLNMIYATSPRDDGSLVEVRLRALDGGGYWRGFTDTDLVTSLDLSA